MKKLVEKKNKKFSTHRLISPHRMHEKSSNLKLSLKISSQHNLMPKSQFSFRQIPDPQKLLICPRME
jgi:hypothetical protein